MVTTNRTPAPGAARPNTGHFAWDTIPAPVRDWLQKRTEDIVNFSYRQACDTVRIGAMLEDAKKKLKHGAYEEWVRSELPFSLATAHRYRQIARAFAAFQTSQFERFDPSALYVLAREDTPQDARELAVSLANDGEKITHARALEIVEGSVQDDEGDEDEPGEEEVAGQVAAAEQGERDEDEEPEGDDEEQEDDDDDKDETPTVQYRGCMGAGCERQFPKDGVNFFCPQCRRERGETEVDTGAVNAERGKKWLAFEQLVESAEVVRVERVEDEGVYSVTCHLPDRDPTNAVHPDLYAAISTASGNPEMRWCSGPDCECERPIGNFGVNRLNPGGFMYRCRKCEKARKETMREERRKGKQSPPADD